jgi:hypothetical protein
MRPSRRWKNRWSGRYGGYSRSGNSVRNPLLKNECRNLKSLGKKKEKYGY